MALHELAQHLATYGEDEDKVLAHINPEEAAFLAQHFGGDINPHTGLPQYGLFKKIKKGLKHVVHDVTHPGDLIKDVGNLAQGAAPFLSFIPGVGPVLSGAVGAGGSLLSGDSLSEALKHGLGGALGSLGIGALGGGLGSLLGSDSALGGYLSGLGNDSVLAGLLGAGSSTVGIPTGGFQIGNTVYDAAGNIVGEQGSTSGLLGGLGSLLGNDSGGNVLSSLLGGGSGSTGGNVLRQLLGGGAGGAGGLGSLAPLLLGGALGAALGNKGGGHSEGVQKDVLSDEQKAYFNRPTMRTDFDALRNDASASGQSLNKYIAGNWDKFMRGSYNQPWNPNPPTSQAPTAQLPTPASQGMPQIPAPGAGTPNQIAPGEPNPSAPPSITPKPLQVPAPQQPPQQGGNTMQSIAQNLLSRALAQQQQRPERGTSPLSQYAQFAHGGSAGYMRGGGSGRADTIPARLSDGEYVMDAETVAMLGDGSNQHGAQKLDEMRRNIRMHKGRAMTQGRFSPDAKSPLSYLKDA